MHSFNILFIMGGVAVAILLTVFWVWAMIHCARRINAGEPGLVGWLIAICLTQVVGAVAYFLFGKRRTLDTPTRAAHAT